jgi:hypothetical protein
VVLAAAPSGDSYGLEGTMSSSLTSGGEPISLAAAGGGGGGGAIELPSRGIDANFTLPSLGGAIHGAIDWVIDTDVADVEIGPGLGPLDPATASGHVVVLASAAANCPPPNKSQRKKGKGWIDPSGVVTAQHGIPLAHAKVTLLRAPQRTASLSAVANGSVTMSPANRRNPDFTNPLGHFGWDVVPGFYEVTASHAGCHSRRTTLASTGVFPVPPPVSNLVLTLSCRGLHRKATALRANAVRVGRQWAVGVKLSVRGAQGVVTLRRGSRVVGESPLDPRTGTASFTLSLARAAGVTATYGGDASHAPSSARVR